ncbi:hypothetical protein BAE44_0022330, partial [Dichanthelium oligosanthes]
LKCRKRVAKAIRKSFDTLVMLIIWKIWLQRNERVFKVKATTASSVIKNVLEEAHCWITACMADLAVFLFPHG